MARYSGSSGKMSSIKAIIFDCFGVLTVNAHQHYNERFTEEQGHEFHDLNQMRDHGFLDQEGYFTALSRLSGDSVEDVREHFTKNYHLNTELLEYIRTILKPKYKIGMLSNMGREWIQDIFTEEDLALFDTIVLSGEEGVTKPNPLMYERAAERLDVAPEECVMVDDMERNCAGARNVGMRAVLFDTTQRAVEILTNMRM